ncbi:hypothetical protein B0H17DRAFT_634429 [Mycena rosella]|uniref:MYND-type domain-containing protein n=1 Tax=Mycena rosella TaxID=1033263 RepID=A0AAD7DES7_MYCRO|nr:hypothetical protein B0H17DRAFT_634429 [Mycena rosella]
MISPLLDQMNSIGVHMSPPLDSAPGMEELRFWFDHVRRRAALDLNSLNLSDLDTLISGDFVVDSRGEELLDPYEKICLGAFTVIWEVRNRNQCMHLGCNAPMVARLAVCVRCGVLRYCTRECQRAAWNNLLAPHKVLCDMVCELRAGLHMTDPKVWDDLILDSRMGRSAIELLEICRPYSTQLDLEDL